MSRLDKFQRMNEATGFEIWSLLKSKKKEKKSQLDQTSQEIIVKLMTRGQYLVVRVGSVRKFILVRKREM